ncbi:hypothetical protein GGTG_10553 [Gaeumannomyces tritici R3-111a-1]|uniref:FAD-binding PCMH-type domain-containing protein n=1 Tax=Gaeumannomyces tritici (strain R3-111a-1) TaxID=644352 RepID=J3PAM8_GAET3|nr:hypothetical protein GGTG_10553 [Gaeumannomyces tritici R3-111a-1]EJT71294.1 hypothetical protein GGTG_10553 [Gaeumannomyces tritici R3-111a-1]
MVLRRGAQVDISNACWLPARLKKPCPRCNRGGQQGNGDVGSPDREEVTDGPGSRSLTVCFKGRYSRKMNGVSVVCHDSKSRRNRCRVGLSRCLLLDVPAGRLADLISPLVAAARCVVKCIVQPRTADEVSKPVTALAGAGVKFAVRSGGHTCFGGGNGTEDGVTVDLGLKADTTARDDPGGAKVASISPGAKWHDVYDALGPRGLTVAGGRDGAGGWWRAAATASSRRAAACSFAGVWTYTPQAKDVTIYCLLTNLHGSKDQKAFEKFSAFGPSDETGEAKISAFVRQISLPPGQQTRQRDLVHAHVQDDLRMVNKLLAGHEAMVEKLKGIMPDGNFTTQCVLQPLPALFARHSVERGGNVLGRDQVTGNAVLWLGTVSAPTRELGDAAHGLLRAYATETEAHARELGLDVPLRRPVPAGAGDVRRRQCREDEGRGNQFDDVGYKYGAIKEGS